MRRRKDAIAFALAAWINPDRDGLAFVGGRFDVESDTEHASFPEGRGFATRDPATSACWGRWHQWLLVLIDHRDKHKR